MQCRSCSGNEFSKIHTGNYKCLYCGTLFYDEKYLKKKKQKHLKVIISIISLSFTIILTALLFILYYEPSENIIIHDEKVFNENFKAERSFISQDINTLPEPQASINAVYKLPDIIGNKYFLILYENTGKIALDNSRITVRLLSENDEKLATGRGFGFKSRLNPGEMTPVYVLIKEYPEYFKYELDHMPEVPYFIPENGIFTNVFKGEIKEVKLEPGRHRNSYFLRGKIYNRSPYNAEYVKVAVILYNEDKEAIGYSTSFIGEKSLKPGDFDFFEVRFNNIFISPDHYEIFYDGRIRNR